MLSYANYAVHANCTTFQVKTTDFSNLKVHTDSSIERPGRL